MWHQPNSIQTSNHPLEIIMNEQNRQTIGLKRPDSTVAVITPTNNNVPDDEEIQRARKINIISMASGIGFSLIMLFMVMKGMIVLSGPYQPLYLMQFSARLEFTIRYQALGAFTIVVSTLMVMIRRSMLPANDPTADDDLLLKKFKNMTQNGVEQFVMSAVIQMVMACNLEPAYVMVYVPFMAVSFFIGRLAFMIGYPKYRLFGFMVCFGPTLVATLFNAYAALRFLFS